MLPFFVLLLPALAPLFGTRAVVATTWTAIIVVLGTPHCSSHVMCANLLCCLVLMRPLGPNTVAIPKSLSQCVYKASNSTKVAAAQQPRPPTVLPTVRLLARGCFTSGKTPSHMLQEDALILEKLLQKRCRGCSAAVGGEG